MEESTHYQETENPTEKEKSSSKPIKSFLIAFVLLSLIISGYFVFGRKNKNTENTKQVSTEKPTNTITKEELSKHSTKEDCWLAINGKVYDVTTFISSHPGGEAILEGCGKDATTLFLNRPGGKGPHSPYAQSLLPQYEIGELE